MLWRHLRISSVKALTPLLVLAPILVVATSQRVGVYVWSDVSWSFNQASALSNPVVAGFFAFEGARLGGADQRLRLASAARPLRGLMFRLAGGMTWLILANVVGFCILAIYIVVHGGYGFPVWGWHIATILGTFVWALLGFALGAMFGKRWYVYLASALASYFIWLVLTGIARPPYWIVQLYPTALNGTNPFVRYIYLTMLGQSLWYVGLTLVIVAVLCNQLRILRVGSAMLISGVSCIIGCIAVISTGGQFTTGYNSRDYTCGQAKPIVCTLRPFAAGNARIASAFAGLNRRASETPLAVQKLEQQVEGVGDEPSEGARSLYIEDLGPGFANIAVEEYVQHYGGSENCVDADHMIAHSILESWLAGERSPFTEADGDVRRAARFLADGATSKQIAWFKANYSAFESCTLLVGSIR